MMKQISLVLTIFLSFTLSAQDAYFQQEVNYTIAVELNDKEKTISGFQTMVYKNNANSSLDFIWMHIYPNAYRDQNTSLFQQILNDPSRKEKLSKKLNYGRIDGLEFKVNGAPAKVEPHANPQYVDVIKVLLPTPLKPGDSAIITTPFKVLLPSYFSRSGFADGQFIVTQWHPKPAVFDKAGWHEMPYLDMGEFYNEFGRYHVSITVPSDYIVSATGVLQTKEELDIYKQLGSANLGRDKKFEVYKFRGSGATKTLEFVAEQVPDFAWFADKNYLIQYDTLQFSNGRVVDAFTFFYDRKNTPWSSSMSYVKDATRSYSNWLGEYAYPTVQAVEGPKNNSSGGMEYPMVTLITSPNSKPETLDAIIAHEVGHNWFMSFLGSNEREYPWLDEGLNSYFQFRYEAEKYRGNAVMGDAIPPALKKLPADDFLAIIYRAFTQIPMDHPIQTASYEFKKADDYGITAYVKTALWVYVIERTIGKEKLDQAFRDYFAEWKFKHPQPDDLKASFEKSTGMSMEGLFELLRKKGSL